MKIEAVIFDLDGTLVDSIPDIVRAANKMLADHNYKIHETQQYLQWIGNGAKKLIGRALPDNTGEEEVIICLNEFLDNYRNNYAVLTKPYKEIDEVLDFLFDQNVPVVILSNKPHDLTIKVVDHYFPDRRFYNVLGQRDGFAKKPDPAIALDIVTDLKLLPKNVLFIGDSATDIETAIAAGMIPAGVTWGYGTIESLKNADFEHIFNKPKEIISFFNNYNSER